MKNNARHAFVAAGFVFALVFLSFAAPGLADMKDIKAYKEAFPNAKVKCATCHTDTMPKTGAGALNDYGQAAMTAGTSPSAETYRQLGKAEDFKK